MWAEPGPKTTPNRSVCIPSFPNLFLLTGPNTLPSGHSTLVGIECSVAYILRMVSGSLAKDSTTPTESVKIQITPGAHRRFDEGIQAWMGRLVCTQDVRSRYVDGRSGRNTLVWPGTQLAFW